MKTALFHSEAFRRHLTPPGHPEQVARLQAVEAGLAGLSLLRLGAPLADEADILRCHPERYLRHLQRTAPAEGLVPLDPDTWMSPGTLEAALRAVGGACAAVDAVLTGMASNAFVAARPPGHHAETETAMGFCLFGTVAIAARRALDHHGLNRVGIVDFDVHHGNGTQDLLWDEPRIRFISSHEMPLFPGTGARTETGAHGQITNLPLAAGSDGDEMWRQWQPALQALGDWRPELILVSAGFDAHAADPLAHLRWQTSDYARLTGAICDVAEECCRGRVVSCLEGGYDLPALTASVAAHVGVLQERGGR